MTTTRTTPSRTTGRRQKSAATGRTKSSLAGKERRDVPAIEDLVAKIRKLQLQEADKRTGLIRSLIEIGEQLQALREQTEHGEWLKRLEELGYGERQAQRLMQFAGSALAGQIRPTVTDLGRRLPTDMQKLASLARLSLEQLEELLKDANLDLDDMSRDDVSKQVRELPTGDEEVAESAAHVIPLNPNTSNEEPTKDRLESEDAPSKEADADGAQGACASSAGEKATNVADHNRVHQRRVQSLHRMANGTRREHDRPVEIAVDKTYVAFEAKVIRLAGEFGRKACNKAIRAINQDDTLLAMLLLSRLKDRLDPSTAFAPDASPAAQVGKGDTL